MTRIYGIDPDKKIPPVMVRGAIIKCFVLAHKEILEEMREYDEFKSEKEFEEMKRLDVEILIKKLFDDVGGDFETPTKESIIKVCDKLADFAENFRGPDIIKKHYGKIMQPIKMLG